MDFTIVIEDLKQLVGQKLQSIRPGAEITIDDINIANERVSIVTVTGKKQSRPFSELRFIWQKLHEYPAIHVDETLHGSGTSRNQPETLMVNLPYIEWFKYNNKKHIALVGNHTHPLGTKKQMDEASAEILREKLRGNFIEDLTTIIVSDDLPKAIHLYESMTGVAASMVCMGVYIVRQTAKSILFVSIDQMENSLPVGTYLVINKPFGYDLAQQIKINGIGFCIKKIYGLNLMIKIM